GVWRYAWQAIPPWYSARTNWQSRCEIWLFSTVLRHPGMAEALEALHTTAAAAKPQLVRSLHSPRSQPGAPMRAAMIGQTGWRSRPRARERISHHDLLQEKNRESCAPAKNLSAVAML